jgi:hypothetical protein
MTIIVNEEAAIGSFMPTTVAALAGAEAAFAGPIVDIEAKLVGAAAASATIAIQPPSLDLVAAIEGALQVPGASVSIESMLTLGSSLEADLGALQLALQLVLAVKGDFAASVQFLAVEGAVADMAGDLAPALAGDAGTGGVAVMLVAKESGAVAALKTLFAL